MRIRPARPERCIMDWLLRLALAHVTCGNLQVTAARGATYSFGDGTGPPIAVRFVSMRAQRSVLLDPDLKLGEAYMDGTFVVDRGSIAEFVDLVANEFAWPWWSAPIALFRFGWRRVRQRNWRRRSRRNVAHHYDLDGRLYSLFLDSDRQYSCSSKTDIGFLTSAAAGAGLRSMPRRSAAPGPWASRFRRSSSQSRASAPRNASWKAPPPSRRSTIAT